MEPFIGRERRQSLHLNKALLGRHQKSFKNPKKALEPLRRTAIGDVNAHNGYARRKYLRAIGREVEKAIGIGADGSLRRPAFLITVVDGDQALGRPGLASRMVLTPQKVRFLQGYFADLLKGLTYVGMIDVALYVSVRTVWSVDRLLLPHAHVIVWGTTEARLARRLKPARGRISSLLPYGSSIDIKLITPGDHLQVLWYAHKLPRAQYQVWRRRKGLSLKQYKRPINGVNAVRIYKALRNLRLDDLVLCGGKGRRVFRRAVVRSKLPLQGKRAAEAVQGW